MKQAKDQYINSVNLNSDTDFPYLVLDVVNENACPRNPGFQVMHWHEDLQFIYVLEGKIEVRTLEQAVQVQKGEGIFINKDVVHHVRKLENCHYNSFLFPAYFLEFYPGSPAREFVDSVTEKEQIAIFHFIPGTGWHSQITEELRNLAEIEKNKLEFYPYEVLVHLTALWLKFRRNLAIPPKKKESAVNLRMQKILRFIENHYGEEITLENLAKSADISKSECSRCFRQSLHTTPYKYLNEYRLSKAAQLLKKTNESVGNIAAHVGFHQMSYFGKCFKEKTGLSPKEYRKQKSTV